MTTSANVNHQNSSDKCLSLDTLQVMLYHQVLIVIRRARCLRTNTSEAKSPQFQVSQAQFQPLLPHQSVPLRDLQRNLQLVPHPSLLQLYQRDQLPLKHRIPLRLQPYAHLTIRALYQQTIRAANQLLNLVMNRQTFQVVNRVPNQALDKLLNQQ